MVRLNGILHYFSNWLPAHITWIVRTSYTVAYRAAQSGFLNLETRILDQRYPFVVSFDLYSCGFGRGLTVKCPCGASNT
jgi:hypothetical protein